MASIAVIATNPECARIARKCGAEFIYVSALNYSRGAAQMCGRLTPDPSQAGYPSGTIIQIPAVDRFSTLDPWKNIHEKDKVLVENLGALFHTFEQELEVHAGLSLNILNVDSLAVIAGFGASLAWLSTELNLNEIAQISRDARRKMADANLTLGVKVAGAQELMTTEHCILMSEGACDKNCASCRRRTKSRALLDRKDYTFPVITDAEGRSHVYNSVELDVIPDIPELLNAGISAFMIDATLMDAEQTAHAVGRLRKALELAEVGEALPKIASITSGHFHRGVM